MKFTENEIKFLKETINYQNRESQKSDNYCNSGLDTATNIFKGNVQAGKGLISSLVKKGIGHLDDEGYDIFWLNDCAIDTVYDALGLD